MDRAVSLGDHSEATRSHVVQFYEATPFLLDAASAFIAPVLSARGGAVVVAVAAHRQGIADRLTAFGVDPESAAADGRYVSLDAETLLAQLCRDGMPDAERFTNTVSALIECAGRGGRPVRVYGEMASLLADGNHAACICLEKLWNGLQQEHDFSLLCAHRVAPGNAPGAANAIEDLCAVHSQAIPAESYSALLDEADRVRAVVAMQCKAQWLEAEALERHSTEDRLRAALASEQVARLEAQAAKTLHDAQLVETAHQLRNPLTSLSLNAQLSLRQLRRDHALDLGRMESSLLAIVDQAARMSVLLDQLRDASMSSAEALPPVAETRSRAS